jgi:molybdopterin molybdotransferase
MIPYAKARKLVRNNTPLIGTEEVPVAHARGRRLATDVESRVGSPPFNKAAMDGFAVRQEDVQELPAELSLVEETFAGQWPAHEVGTGECARITTGAPVPPGADMVVMVEHTEELPGGTVRVEKLSGGNICVEGEDVGEGETVLQKDQLLHSMHLGVAGGAGHDNLTVYRHPGISVLCTGEEVREPGAELEKGQIYNSNGPIMRSLLSDRTHDFRYLGVVGDDEMNLKSAVEEGLESDVFVLSGGVSMGEYDLVPGVLRDLGVEILFHKWKVKPGKPALFGRRGKTCVFGLPGNPQSVFVTCHLLVHAALAAMEGASKLPPRFETGRITENLTNKPGRRSVKPCHIEVKDSVNRVLPISYHGSADIAASAKADAFFTLPEDCTGVQAGDPVQYFRI